MDTGDLLIIHPTELKFPFELRKQSSCSTQLTNKTNDHVAYKVKKTNPKKYSVRPNTGVVLSGGICDVTALQFNKEEGRVVEDFKLNVIYIPANPPSPIPEESEEGSPPHQNGNEPASLASSVGRSFMDSRDKSSEEFEPTQGFGVLIYHWSNSRTKRSLRRAWN